MRVNHEDPRGDGLKVNLIKDFVRGAQRGSRLRQEGVMSCQGSWDGHLAESLSVGLRGTWGPADPCTDPGRAEEPTAL